MLTASGFTVVVAILEQPLGSASLARPLDLESVIVVVLVALKSGIPLAWSS